MASDLLVKQLWQIAQNTNSEKISMEEFSVDLRKSIDVDNNEYDRVLKALLQKAKANPTTLGQTQNGKFVISDKIILSAIETVKEENKYIPGTAEFKKAQNQEHSKSEGSLFSAALLHEIASDFKNQTHESRMQLYAQWGELSLDDKKAVINAQTEQLLKKSKNDEQKDTIVKRSKEITTLSELVESLSDESDVSEELATNFLKDNPEVLESINSDPVAKKEFERISSNSKLSPGKCFITFLKQSSATIIKDSLESFEQVNGQPEKLNDFCDKEKVFSKERNSVISLITSFKDYTIYTKRTKYATINITNFENSYGNTKDLDLTSTLLNTAISYSFQIEDFDRLAKSHKQFRTEILQAKAQYEKQQTDKTTLSKSPDDKKIDYQDKPIDETKEPEIAASLQEKSVNMEDTAITAQMKKDTISSHKQPVTTNLDLETITFSDDSASLSSDEDKNITQESDSILTSDNIDIDLQEESSSTTALTTKTSFIDRIKKAVATFKDAQKQNNTSFIGNLKTSFQIAFPSQSDDTSINSNENASKQNIEQKPVDELAEKYNAIVDESKARQVLEKNKANTLNNKEEKTDTGR